MSLPVPTTEGALGGDDRQMVYEALRRIARLAMSRKDLDAAIAAIPASSSTTTVNSSVNWVSVLDHGAQANVLTVDDGAMTAGIGSGSYTLTSASGLFTPSDVGKIITVRGAGMSGPGHVLVTTIAAYTSATIVTLAAACTYSVTAAVVNWGSDDTAAFQAALDSLPSSGGVVYAPTGAYFITAQLMVGNATHSHVGPPYDTISTIQAPAFIGDSLGATVQNIYTTATTGSQHAGTRLCWASTTAAPMVFVSGPIEGVRVENLFLDANGLASGGLDIHRAFTSTFRRITTVNWGAGYAYCLRANDGAYVTGGGGPNTNVFEQVNCMDPSGSTAYGFQLAPGNGNCNQNTFIRCKWLTSSNISSPALDLQYADHNSFYHCYGGRNDWGLTGIGLQLTTQGGHTPGDNYFHGSTWTGGINYVGAAPAWPGPLTFHFPWDCTDSEPIPPAGSNGTTLPANAAWGTTFGPVWPYGDTMVIGAQNFQNRLAYTMADKVLVNGNNHNISLPDTSYVRITGPTGAFTVTGFDAVINGSGRLLHLFNSTIYDMTIKYQSASSDFGKRITTRGGTDVTLTGSCGFATFLYEPTTASWILASHN